MGDVDTGGGMCIETDDGVTPVVILTIEHYYMVVSIGIVDMFVGG